MIVWDSDGKSGITVVGMVGSETAGIDVASFCTSLAMVSKSSNRKEY